jgi:hypothetical protein
VEFDPEEGVPETKSDPLPELVELCTDVDAEADVDAEVVVEVVEVTVTVEVMWTVVCEVVPAPSPLPAPPGDSRTCDPPNEEGALPLKACVATKTDPVPARTTRTRTDTTDSL